MTASPGVTATTAGLHLHSWVSPSRPQSWIQDGVSSGQTPLLPAMRVSGSQVADPLQPGSGFVSTHEVRLVPVLSVFTSCPRLSNYPNLKNLPFALKHTRTFLVPGFPPCCSICLETCDPCSCLSWFISCLSGLWLVLPPPLILLACVSSPSFSPSHHSALDNIDFSLQWSWLLMHSLADLSLPLEYHLLKCRDFSACSQLHAGVKSQCLGQSTDSMNISWVNKWMKICTDENVPISNWGSPSNAFQVGRHDVKGTYTIHHLRKVPQIFHWATLRADKFSCQRLFLHHFLLLS